MLKLDGLPNTPTIKSLEEAEVDESLVVECAQVQRKPSSVVKRAGQYRMKKCYFGGDSANSV